jgi:hypothetical protein
MKPPTCPEICLACREGRHVLHVEDELASLIVHISTRGSDSGRVPHRYEIIGDADLKAHPGDPYYWLRLILNQASQAVEKTRKWLQCDQCGHGGDFYDKEGDKCRYVWEGAPEFDKHCHGTLHWVERKDGE